MKANIFKMMVAAMVCATAMVMVSCSNNDSDIIANEVKDYSSGIFDVINLSAYETIEQSAEVINGDTLLIRFTPKQTYHNYSFSVSCNGMKKVNDSIFVVNQMTSGIHQVEIVASYTIGTEVYQATKTLSLNIPKSYIVMPMIVTVSSDLKPFVDIELSYTDKKGKEHKFLIKEEEWVKPDSVTSYLYEAEDGTISYGHVVPDGCKIIEENRYAPACFFVLNTRFFDLENDVTTTFTARYIRKQNIKLEREEYRFTHYIDRKSAKVSIPGKIVIDAYTSINIDLTDHTVRKENVVSYLEELSAKPDIKKFELLTSGNIESVK